MTDRLAVDIREDRLISPDGNETQLRVDAVCLTWEINTFSVRVFKVNDEGLPQSMLQLRVNTEPHLTRGGYRLRIIQMLEKAPSGKDVGLTAERVNSWILGDVYAVRKRDKGSLMIQLRGAIEPALMLAILVPSPFKG